MRGRRGASDEPGGDGVGRKAELGEERFGGRAGAERLHADDGLREPVPFRTRSAG